MDNLIQDALKELESRGEITPETVGTIEQHLDEIVKSEINEVEEIIDKEPYLALGRLTTLSFFLNAAIKKRPLLLKKLEKWVKKIKEALSKLAKKVGAVGFNISVGLPAGISISISFSSSS